jgi:hypothetical protein
MPTSTRGSGPDQGTPSPLAEALDKSKQATEDVKKAADDLAVVHAVLDTKLARGASDGDVARAVAETDKVEKRLTRSAEKLDEVNETLERETRGPA